MIDQDEDGRHAEPARCADAGSDAEVCLHTLALGVEGSEREIHMYAQYVRALALLCECAPFVEEADYADLIDELLADACKNYPLEWRRDGVRRQIALRSPVPD